MKGYLGYYIKARKPQWDQKEYSGIEDFPKYKRNDPKNLISTHKLKNNCDWVPNRQRRAFNNSLLPAYH